MVKNDVSEGAESCPWFDSAYIAVSNLQAAWALPFSICIMLGRAYSTLYNINYSITRKKTNFQAESKKQRKKWSHYYIGGNPYEEQKFDGVGWDNLVWWYIQSGPQELWDNSHSKSPKTNELRNSKIDTHIQKLNWFLYCRVLMC